MLLPLPTIVVGSWRRVVYEEREQKASQGGTEEVGGPNMLSVVRGICQQRLHLPALGRARGGGGGWDFGRDKLGDGRDALSGALSTSLA